MTELLMALSGMLAGFLALFVGLALGALLPLPLLGQCRAGSRSFWGFTPDRCELLCARPVTFVSFCGQVSTSFPRLVRLLG